MSNFIYGKLALTNLKNNRKTYVPYIFTAILTVMMYYIMDALSRNSSITQSKLQSVLVCAVGVIAIFAVIFLFYTNSFLIKRRKKELGVYNILGMGKRHIAQMLMVETAVTAVVSVGAGLVSGVVFSKLMYLVLLKILHYDVRMDFEISMVSVRYTLLLFAGIFCMTLVYNLFQIRLANPVELIHGGSCGEKEPKTKWLLTIFGALSLGAGYYIAVTTEAPLQAIQSFFVAVVCVILGTYALFVAGSIALLKALRRNKRFYYQTKHFSAVSGMIYRMKQNAVGLANICILSTMVLVMISTTISLYIGMEDVLKGRFPKEFVARTNVSTPEADRAVERIIKEETKAAGVKPASVIRYHDGGFVALKTAEGFELQEFGDYTADGVVEVVTIPLEDYIRQACADFVLSLPEGLDTRCGEMGNGLSEGQAQRIAIARALLRRGSILLLDEATSALDLETEQQLLKNLTQNQLKNKTLLFITHRRAVVEYCSQVLHLKKQRA